MTSTASHPPARAEAPPRTAPSAVSLRNVKKAFKLPHQQYHTLKERALHPFRKNTYDVLQAVDDVSLEIAEGEFFGIVGRNGSGKSTLLKCLAGIYDIDDGELRIEGRLSPFIELGVGFNMDLTARDNVMINAIMLGLTPRQARERFDDIIAFAELEDFLDLKLKNYSSGMTVRLAFSVAIQVDAEILLIDEVLAVGDASFQQKCFDEFRRLKEAGRTILFVTHDMGAVKRFCDRAVLLERGRIVELGDPDTVARRYLKLNFERAARGGGPEAELDPLGAEILDAWFEDAAGARIERLRHGDRCSVCMEARFHAPVEDPRFGFMLRNDVGGAIFATSTDVSGEATGRFAAGEAVVVRMTFDNVLTKSTYSVSPSIERRGGDGEAEILDERTNVAELVVHDGPWTGAVVNLPHTFAIERSAP